MLLFDMDMGRHILDTVPNGFSFGLFCGCEPREMSSLLSVTVVCSCGWDGMTGAVLDSTCSDDKGGDDVGGGDVDEVKTVERAFNGPDFRKPLLLWKEE